MPSQQLKPMVLEAFNLSYDDLGSVLDTVTAVSQKTGVSVDDLMTKAVEGAPQIKALGLSFGEEQKC